MAQINRNDLLRALEADNPQPDTIIQAAQAVTNTAEERIPGTDDSSLTPYNKTAVLLQVLSMQMHPKDLCAWLTDHAVDLEVYQLAHSAQEIRDTAAALNVPNGDLYPLVASIATDMARNANHSAAVAYDSAMTAKRQAIESIMYTYGEAALTALKQALEEIKTAVKDMPEPGSVIYNSCDSVLSKLGTSTSPATPILPDAPAENGPIPGDAREAFSARPTQGSAQ